MNTINIALPEALECFVNDQVTTRGYSSSSEYVRELIRRDYDRQCLRARLLAGATSPKGAVVDTDYFDLLRDGVSEVGQR